MSCAQRVGSALLSRRLTLEVQKCRHAGRGKITSSLAAAALVAALAVASASVGSATLLPPRHLEVISGSGKVTTSIGAGSASVRALVRQPDGKLVAAGAGVI